MVKINPFNVVRLLLDVYDIERKKTPINNHEVELMEQLRGIIDSCPYSTDVRVDVETVLDFEKDSLDHTVDKAELQAFLEEEEDQLWSSQSQRGSQPSQPSSEYQPTPEEDKTLNIVDFEYKTKAVKYWRERNGQPRKKRLKWISVQHNFAQLRNASDLHRWAKQVDEGQKTNIEKLIFIFQATADRFIAARQQRIIVHDVDIRRWALMANLEVGIPNFVASPSWVLSFKKKLRIVSRKVTKFVTREFTEEQANLKGESDYFVELEAKPHLENRGMAAFGNSDQCGCPRELHSGRSLTFQGEKHVPGRVQSESAMTHSSTIQPVITCDGRMFPKLLVCIQKIGGKFGPRVEKNMFKADNIHAMASTSGKLTKNHVLAWLQEDYFPFAEQDSTLLLDSWSGQKDQVAIAATIPAGKTLRLLTIPPGTTSMIQPCDVYLFRIWKSCMRKFQDRGLLDGLPVVFHQRNSILKLQSILHNQFSSPRFRPQIQYAFYKAGYHDERPPKFQTVSEYCFDSVSLVEECFYCQSFYFIRCGWCTRTLCFNCCWNGHKDSGYHYCQEYLE